MHIFIRTVPFLVTARNSESVTPTTLPADLVTPAFPSRHVRFRTHPPNPPCELENSEQAERPQRRKCSARSVPRLASQDIGWREDELQQPANNDETVEQVEVVLCVLPGSKCRNLQVIFVNEVTGYRKALG